MAEIIPKPENVAQLIYLLRGEKVMLDAELARLYAVPTKALNQAVKRNRDRFPEDFVFQLSNDEWADLRCQFGISSNTGAGGNRSHSVTGSQRHRDPRLLPYAFTEQGVAMREPGGFEAISRWSSEAIPPAASTKIRPHPGGVPDVRPGHALAGVDASTPPGCVSLGPFGTGGVGLRPRPPANL